MNNASCFHAEHNSGYLLNNRCISLGDSYINLKRGYFSILNCFDQNKSIKAEPTSTVPGRTANIKK